MDRLEKDEGLKYLMVRDSQGRIDPTGSALRKNLEINC